MDNSDNEDYFAVRYSGTQAGSPDDTGDTTTVLDAEVADLALLPGYTYNIYVAAVNSAGEAASNTITVTAPLPMPTASLSAAVSIGLPTNPSNYGLVIIGNDFGANELVTVIVDWKIGNGQPGAFTIGVNANQAGYFKHWFPGNDPEGLCPDVPPGGSPPTQTFNVTATGQTSGKSASAPATSFMCP